MVMATDQHVSLPATEQSITRSSCESGQEREESLGQVHDLDEYRHRIRLVLHHFLHYHLVASPGSLVGGGPR